jgi:hypothetical protein
MGIHKSGSRSPPLQLAFVTRAPGAVVVSWKLVRWGPENFRPQSRCVRGAP